MWMSCGAQESWVPVLVKYKVSPYLKAMSHAASLHMGPCAGLICTSGKDTHIRVWDPRQGVDGGPLTVVFDVKKEKPWDPILSMISARAYGEAESPFFLTGVFSFPCARSASSEKPFWSAAFTLWSLTRLPFGNVPAARVLSPKLSDCTV
jgi:hypothetical protein